MVEMTLPEDTMSPVVPQSVPWRASLNDCWPFPDMRDNVGLATAPP